MANHNVSFYADSETSTIISTPLSQQDIAQGDTVTFIHNTSGVVGNITVTNFLSSEWTNTSDLVLAKGTQSVKTIKSDATLGTGFVDITRASYTSASYLFNILTEVDTTPDAFDLGPNKIDAELSTYYYSDLIIVSGINSATGISRTGDGEFIISNQSWVTAGSVNNGSTVRCRILADSAYGTAAKTITLDIGGVTDTFSVTTLATAAPDQIIPLGIVSGSLKLSDIQEHFGGPVNSFNPPYLKGGAYVPNITENVAIPVSGNLRVRDFLGSAMSFFIETNPISQTLEQDVSVSGGTFAISWYIETDWDLGYGEGANNTAEFSYAFSVDQTEPVAGAPTIVGSSPGTYGTYSDINTNFTLTVTVPSGVDRYYKGTVTLRARSKKDNTKIVFAIVEFIFDFYGN